MQVKPVNIRLAVNPMVAWPAQSQKVRQIEPEGFVSCPRPNVMGMKRAGAGFPCTARDASVFVASVHGALDILPSTRSVKPLALRRAAVSIIRVGRAHSAAHAISSAAQIGLLDRSLRAKHSFRLGAVRLSGKRIPDARPAHVVVFARQVGSAGPCWNAKIAKFRVNALRVAPDYGADLVGREPFDLVLLTEPDRVQMRRFHPAMISDSARGLS